MNPKIYIPQLTSIIAQSRVMSKELDKIANDIATYTPKSSSESEQLKAKLADEIVEASAIFSRADFHLAKLGEIINTLQLTPTEPRVQRWIFQNGKPIAATVEDVAKVRGMTVAQLLETEAQEEAEAFDIISGEGTE